MGLTAFPYTSVLNLPADTILGNNIGVTSKAIALTPSQVRTLLDIYDTAYIDNALSLKADLVGGLIPAGQLPSYVDDVLEYANITAFPPIGESGKIYVAIDSSRTYRWSGSTYIEITDTTALWGAISGTLSNQTDLTTFLANTYTPQTRTVSTGTGLNGGGDLSANRTLSLANTAVAAGAYGSDSQVASFTVDAQGRLTAAGNVAITGRLPIGGTAGQILAKIDATDYNAGWIDNYAKEVVQYVKNSTHTTLLKGQAVYVNGADGTNPTIALSQANAESSSSKTLGILKQDLASGEFGYVVTEGFLDGLNTNAATTEGDPIWLSPTVAGGFVYGVLNKPYAPNHMVFLGYVVRKNANNGRIYVKVQNGFELKELHDVAAQSPNDGDIIRYSTATNLWSAQAPPVGYTNENAQDAVGGIVQNSSNVSLSYNDNTPSLLADLVDTSVVAGGYGSTSQVATFTVDAKGRLTAAGSATITPSSIGALGSLNGLTGSTQTFETGTSGTDFNIVSSGTAHAFNLPDASATARGVVTTGSQTFAGTKTFTRIILPGNSTSADLRAGSGTGIFFSNNGTTMEIMSSFYSRWRFNNSLLQTWGQLAFCPDFSFTPDSIFGRDAVGSLYIRSSTTSQKLSLFNTFTDASNYERLAFQFGTFSSVRHAQIAAESAGTGTANINLVLTPRGTGALIAGPPPDGTATGGNVRGQYAIDLQLGRTAATNVATANYGVNIGFDCTTRASTGGGANTDGCVAIGKNVSVTDSIGGAVGIGSIVTCTGYRSVAIGRGVQAGSDAIAIGAGAVGTNSQAVCIGVNTQSRFDGGIQWTSRVVPSSTAYNGTTYFGGRQYFTPSVRTTNATLTTLYATLVTTPLDNRFRHLTALLFVEFTIFAITAGQQLNKYQRKVLVKDLSNNAGSASTLTILQTETVGTDIVEISGVSFSVTVDSATKKLIISVTGQADYAVTGNSSTDVLTAIGNNFVDGDVVVFTALTGGAGFTTNATGQYYQGIYRVMNKSGDTFQLSVANSSTPAAVNFTTDITAGTICRPILWYTDDIKFTAAAGGY